MGNEIDLSGFDEELNASKDIDLSGFDQELSATPEVKTAAGEDQLSAPVVGYGAGKLAQSGLESAGSALMKLPEKAARLAGGLTDEQVDYYQQNYKQMEAGKGISQESVDEGFSRIEDVFKGKNIEANKQRQLAEEALQVPFTKELAESSMSKALPKVMSKIDTESAPFQNVLKDRVTAKKDAEVARLTNLLEEKKQKDEKKRELAVLEMNESIEEFNTVASNEIKEKPKTREQLLLEFDNDEDDETEEILDQSDNEEDITIIETEFDELCGEEELDNEIANLDNDLHVPGDLSLKCF